MKITYYKTKIGSQINLAYASRRRYGRFPLEEVEIIAEEEQQSVVIGDGAHTSIKTSIANACQYVTIEVSEGVVTRWYVVEKRYLNGGQVRLYLQRDVIGENGLTGFVGKIERGYTNSVIRNRKELSLNEVLKERKPLIPNVDEHLNYLNISVNTHENEKWGLLYLLRSNERIINIPEISKSATDTSTIPAEIIKTCNTLHSPDNTSIGGSLYLKVHSTVSTKISFFKCYLNWVPNPNSPSGLQRIITVNATEEIYPERTIELSVRIDNLAISGIEPTDQVLFNIYKSAAQSYVNDFCNTIENNTGNYSKLPPLRIEGYENSTTDYSEKTYLYNGKYYGYKKVSSTKAEYGTVNSQLNQEQLEIRVNSLNAYGFNSEYSGLECYYYIQSVGNDAGYYAFINSVSYWNVNEYTRKELTYDEAGVLNLTTVNQNLIDEPYILLAIPLYDCIVTDKGENKEYSVQRNKAFNIFNSIIRDTSGENPILVDAQIYPYAPDFSGVANSIQGVPVLIATSTFSERLCDISLLPYIDVKKEYIKRNYVMVSPEKSGRFSFNFYDYTNEQTELIEGSQYNSAKLRISIKTAYKPFGIVSCAVIQPKSDSLIGMTYSSDMRGSMPTGNGFQCSLSSNAFETYKRQNSNYQQIFNKQEEELRKNHQVERVNDITASIMNTLSATMMGAIGGGQLGELGVGELFGSKAGGAAVGAGIAGSTVGAAMTAQTIINESMRRYEMKLLKERFDLNIGTIKNIPDSLNRVSTFNEIIVKDFWYMIEIYECTEEESEIADTFIEQYGYGIGVFGLIENFYKNGWFIRSTLIKSNLEPLMHTIASNELEGGIYLYD